MSKPARPRIDQLDGLRGLAIILVVLNHLPFEPLYRLAPAFMHPWMGALTGNGKVGVSILFMLSGFLMVTLYPVVHSKLAFWQKRYTRIFPAFIVMSIALSVIRFFGQYLPVILVPLMVVTATVGGGMIWRRFQQLPHRIAWGKRLFYFFIGVQIITALAYLLVLTQVPPAIFYQVWSEWWRQLITFIINATMTLPFGVYAPQLDGVYWSVVAEVLFYVLYPTLFVPLFSLITQKKSKVLSVVALFAMFPFIYGTSLLFNSISGFSILHIHFVIYFIAGMVIGYSRNSFVVKKVQTTLAQLPALPLILLCTLGIVGIALIRPFTQATSLTETLYWVLPLSLVFIVTLDAHHAWSKMLTTKFLMMLGYFSYSIYLTHSISIEMFTRSGGPKTSVEMLVVVTGALFVTAFLSFLLNHFLEKPYFARPATSASNNTVRSNALKSTTSNWRLPLGLFIVVMFFIWWGYRVPASLSSLVINHRQPALATATQLTTAPLTLRFTGERENLGMVLLYLHPLTDDQVNMQGYTRGLDTTAMLTITLKDESGQIMANNNYDLYQISESRFHPIGLPIDSASAGKEYELTLQLTSERPYQVMMLRNNGTAFRTVYFFGKKELVTQPKLLAEVLASKLFQPFTEPEARKVMLLLAPFVVLVISLYWSEKINLLQSSYGTKQ